ncbi:MAG TPA: PsbP-related protein [bacterium]|nr:PsbP-related protein [bacterium]
MRTPRKAWAPLAGVVLGCLLLTIGSPGGVSVAVGASGTVKTAQANPPGDIPDTQAFVVYRSSAGGYELQVPEGWARTTRGPDVQFTDKFDGVQVTITHAARAPSADRTRAEVVAALPQSGPAVHVTKVQNVHLPSGTTVLVEYTSTSGPDPVTNRRVRLENSAYLFFKSGQLATLTLWAPVGADNVDQWGRMARSFRWL